MSDPVPALGSIERVLIQGDLSKLTEQERLIYYDNRCRALGLDPMSRPFDYFTLSGKVVLYANKGCAEQLRALHGISIRITDRKVISDVYVVTAQAERKSDGRVDESTGAVSILNLKGEALANAYLKCETKAKRRVTLSICGLNMLDESEIESARAVRDVPPTPPEDILRIPEERRDPDILPDPADLRARIAERLNEVSPAIQDLVPAHVERAGDDSQKLSRILNRLEALAATGSEPNNPKE
jgi:hypothetical protein